MSAAAIDGKDAVVGAMGHEDPWPTDGGGGRQNAWRERDDAREQVAIRETQRERVRRAVGEALDRDPRTVNGTTLEDVRQRAVDERDVGAVWSVEEVPRSPA